VIDRSIAHPVSDRIMQLHAQFGHASPAVLRRLLTSGIVPCGKPHDCDAMLNEIKELNYYLCPACLKGKQHRRAISHRPVSNAGEPLGCVMADLCGPIWVTKAGGTKRLLSKQVYSLVLVDYYSRHVTVYILKSKDQAPMYIKEYIIYMERQTEHTVKVFHSDGGGEFLNTDLAQWLAGRGIDQRATAVDAPWENGVVERMNRSLLEMALCILFHAALPATFWIDAYVYAVHLRNCMVWSTAVNGRTPHEALLNVRPQIDRLQVFGCDAYMLVPATQRSKIDAKSMPCIWLGLDPLRQHAAKLYCPATDKYYHAVDVVCDKASFTTPVNGEVRCTHAPQSRTADSLLDIHVGDGDQQIVIAGHGEPTVGDNNPSNDASHDNNIGQQQQLEVANDWNDVDVQADQMEDIGDIPTVVQDENDHSIVEVAPLLPSLKANYSGPLTRRMTGTEINVPFRCDERDVYTGNNKLAIEKMLKLVHEGHALSAIAEQYTEENEPGGDEPISWEEAMESPECESWNKAAASEINSLNINRVYEKQTRQQAGNRKVIPVKWVFKKKRGPRGEVLKYKMRVVVKGFHQVYGVDYTDTYAPTLRIKSLRILLVLVVKYKLKLKQYDFDTAFLNATVSEDIYVQQPPGFVEYDDNGYPLVWKLLKALYGIKQAPHNWNKEIDQFMRSLGFTPLVVDVCVYHRMSQTGNFILVTIFVDDLLSAYGAIDELEWQSYKNAIGNKYKIKELGDCNWILNMRLHYNPQQGVLYLSQEQHIRALLRRTGMDKSDPAKTPMSSTNPPTMEDCPGGKLDAGTENPYREWYQSTVGGLLFIANITRIDITFAVNYLSRYCCNPGLKHVVAVKTVLRYLAGTAGLSLKYTAHKNENSRIINGLAYGDADFAGDKEKRLSTTGWLTMLDGNLVSWQSKRQPTVATSTLHAEYMAMYSTACEARWIQQWFSGADISTHSVCSLQLPIVIYCDNEPAVKLSDHDTNHERTKHIDVKYHYVRDLIADGTISVQWCSTVDQIADILTKPLAKELHHRIRSFLLDIIPHQ
jgi:transposase InsO family protein